MRGPIDFGVWGAVIPNLAYTNLAREVWLEAKLDPYVPARRAHVSSRAVQSGLPTVFVARDVLIAR